MKFLVFGAGAIGTYIGGSLALAEHSVSFIEQPLVAEGLQKRGLRLDICGNQSLITNGQYSVQFTTSLRDALEGSQFDVAIFALKSFDTSAALEGLKPYIEQVPPVLCLQNGVDNENEITTVLGNDKVIAGTVTSSIGRRAAGDIVVERLRGVGVAADHPLSIKLASVLDEAGLNAHLYPRAAEMKWSKMLTNLIANATVAILDMIPVDVFAYPRLFSLEMAMLREMLLVMKAQGIKVVDLPGTPVRALALAARQPEFISRPFLTKAVGGGRGGKMPSFHIDLYSGRGQSEVDWLNGAVVRCGEKFNVPTPVNRILTNILLALTHGETPLIEYRHQPEKLLALVNNAPSHPNL